MPIEAYSQRLTELEAAFRDARSGQIVALVVMGSALALFVILGFSVLFRRAFPVWYPPLPLPVAAISLRLYLLRRRQTMRGSRLVAWYRKGLQRMRGEWAGSGVSGEQYRDANHVFANDLNLFGAGSLFEYVCTTRTDMGRRRLAEWLLAAPPLTETLARQEAIRELSWRTSLREEIALLGEYEFESARWESFAQWLETPASPAPLAVRFAALVSSLALVTLAFAGLNRFMTWTQLLPWMLGLLAVHGIFGLARRRKTLAAMNSLCAVSTELGVFRRGLELMHRQSFTSPKLAGLVERVARDGAAHKVRSLERLARALEQRGKEGFYAPSLAFMFATQVTMSVDNWRRLNGADLPAWLDAWAEFEALNALACYAHENPQHTFPQFISDTTFDAEALGHPLLPRDACVRNDVHLNPSQRCYIVSGSNMSGKSTLLRSIGVNAVLAHAGAPVRARSLTLSPLSVCASISVGDSLLNGTSKFLAEVERMRQTMEQANGPLPVLFLVDEIFSGTNSRDRRAVAGHVVDELIHRGAIGALSTHDLALTELPGKNVHMGSREGAGPLDFDYLLKDGVTQETNAREIARMVGIDLT